MNFADDIDEPRPCQYRCVECGADLPHDGDCEACLARELDASEETANA